MYIRKLERIKESKKQTEEAVKLYKWRVKSENKLRYSSLKPVQINWRKIVESKNINNVDNLSRKSKFALTTNESKEWVRKCRKVRNERNFFSFVESLNLLSCYFLLLLTRNNEFETGLNLGIDSSSELK